ncbi:MAG: S-methyl-5-thioribose-1-phosphate isomerase [Chloroflexi bacterium]|nr:S-methyl-5-thioribose-1-phosphate isomerase [Chloroflexota bacterium]MCI0847927.1 S-methyl-5-thioribose-1-phosphate isomerase [Chloroflexota bacterium]MCI0899449.1 S-methyl-5-thioribose-1-phosphate isomerase [Chloroflexota bacterium]MCI0902374.1 S-methyl-5-thioribose-1-phosphate isomerase [Chloroflexota bacterium]
MRPIEWANGTLRLLDQTRLPTEEVIVEAHGYLEAVDAIKTMRVRGAPAIGVTAAYAVAMAARELDISDKDTFLRRLEEAGAEIKAARPTAVNLMWAVDRMLALARSEPDTARIKDRLVEEAVSMEKEDEAVNRKMGSHGKELMPDGGSVLTHCNAGALATAGYGTAVGVIRAGWEDGKRFKVFNTETRPFLQGARLTAWEFKKLGIPSTLVVDSAAGMLMHRGEIGCVITGADRIAANGDTANKIGTYTLAVLAKENGIPFYVAAPTSTVDMNLPNGDEIEIEERSPSEVTEFRGVPIAPEGVEALNPGFDVTPNRYVSAIITEAGIARPPFIESLDLAIKSVR